MKKTVFEFSDYKRFLLDWLEGQPGAGRGKRTELAAVARCKLAYVSQVLNHRADFSLEQAEAIGRHLGLSPDELEHFLLLLQKDRAGTAPLREMFESQIKRTVEKRKILKDRIGVSEGMSELDRARYYSAWYYTAAHILLTIPQYQARSAVDARLGLGAKKTAQILDFLVKAGLASQEGDHFRATKAKIHLGGDSPEILKHHTNWRNRAVLAAEKEIPEALHYSSVVSIAKRDVVKIREVILQMIEKFRAEVDPSKEEELFAFCVDWFRA